MLGKGFKGAVERKVELAAKVSVFTAKLSVPNLAVNTLANNAKCNVI